MAISHSLISIVSDTEQSHGTKSRADNTAKEHPARTINGDGSRESGAYTNPRPVVAPERAQDPATDAA